MADLLSGLWIFLEALLFGLIGTQIVIENLNLHLIGYGALVMLIALVVNYFKSRQISPFIYLIFYRLDLSCH